MHPETRGGFRRALSGIRSLQFATIAHVPYCCNAHLQHSIQHQTEPWMVCLEIKEYLKLV